MVVLSSSLRFLELPFLLVCVSAVSGVLFALGPWRQQIATEEMHGWSICMSRVILLVSEGEG